MNKAIIAVAVVALTTVLDAQSRRAFVIETDYIVPGESTLREVLAGKDSAVRVSIVKAGQPLVVDAASEARVDIPALKPVPLVATVYQAQVLSVLKADSRAGVVNAVITIGHGGGEGQWQGVPVIDKNNTPHLIAGKEYVVFLDYNEAWHTLMFAPFDVFEVANGQLVANRLSVATRYGAALAGLTVPEATKLIESAAEEAPR